MAVRKKAETKSEKTLPPKLDELAKSTFHLAVREKYYSAEFKASKIDFISYLEENTDGFEIDAGKSTKCEYGSFNYVQKNSVTVDKDALLDALEKGRITIETLVGLGTFAAAKLKDVGLEDVLEVGDPSISLTIKVSDAFKEDFINEVENGGGAVESVVVAPTKKKSKKPTAVATESEIDSILEGVK